MSKSNKKPNGKYRRKAFVFSLDALFSVFVLIVIVDSFSFLSARTYPQSLSQVDLQTKTNDMVVLLDKLGYLSGMDGQNITIYANSTLGPTVGWRLDVEYFNYTGGSNGTFILHDALILGDNNSADDVASGTRIFVVSDNGSVLHYGRVHMLTWFK